jgi:predicted phage terminase large subunit-like protein
MTAVAEEIMIAPQEGPQARFCSIDADIIIYGGAAGGGKTFVELLEGLRNVHVPGFSAVIFRRTYPQITAPGGLWDTSREIYGPAGLVPKESALEWFDPVSGSRIKFAHMQHAKNVYDWQGSQICYIAFDELCHFEQQQFFYMLSRNRSMCGVRPYVRATCNPDPDSWVRRFISWWIDEEKGYPIPERDSKVRWMAREKGEIVWGDTKKSLVDRGLEPKSVTFISANIHDNPLLLAKDPGYVANLKSLPAHERSRLYGGNWNARQQAGSYFKRQMFDVVDAVPKEFDNEIRYWDRAATEISDSNLDPDATVGVRMVVKNGTYYVVDVRRFHDGPGKVLENIKRVSAQEPRCPIALEQDPGQAGKAEMHYLISRLSGRDVYAVPVTASKETRARPYAAQCLAGNVKLVRAPWNEEYLSELESFPTKGCHDDQVDASSGAFNELCEHDGDAVVKGF